MKKTRQLSMVEQLVQDMVEAGQSDIFAGSLKSLKEMDKAIKAQKELTDSLIQAGDNKALRVLAKEALSQQQEQVAAVESLIEARTELARIDKEQNKEAYEAQMAHIRELGEHIGDLATQSDQLQASAKQFGKDMKHGLDQYERLLTQREERFKELGERGAKFEEGFAKRFSASVDAFTGGISDLDGVGNTLTSALSSFGRFLSTKQGEKAALAKSLDDEGKSNAAAGAAQMLGTFSKMAGTLAIVGGSIMALVKLFQFVEGTVIQANKQLLEGTGIIDLMTDSSKNVQENLEQVRNTFRDVSFANEMGIALDETIGLVTSFEKLNIGIKQFGGGKSAMESMKDAMKVARGEAYAMGISMDEASDYMANMAFNLGMSAKDGAVVARMADSFANIRDMALQSSYQTANFFKKVQELTGSLDNMNYRTEEAGTLLIRFAKVLGKSGLDAALSQLFSGFRGEGYLDQLKRNMLSKSEEVRKATEIEAKKMGQTFLNVFGSGAGDNTITGQVGTLVDQLGKMGVNVSSIRGAERSNQAGQKLMEVLGNLDATQRQTLQMRLNKDENITDEMRAELYRAMRLARGSRKGASNTERMAAQEEMGALGNARALMSIIQARVGDADLSQLGYLQKESLTKFGVSKDQIEIFAQLQETFKGQLKEAQRIASLDISEDEKNKQLAKLNAGVKMKGGKLVSGDTESEITGYGDFFQAQADVVQKALDEDQRANMTSEQFLAEGVQATTSVFNVLNNTIAGILNTISQGIYSMTSYFFGKSEDSTEQANKNELVNEVKGALSSVSEEMRDRSSNINKMEQRLASLGLIKNKTAAQAKEKRDIEERLKVAKQKDKEDAATRDTLNEQLRILQTTTYAYGALGSYSKKEMREMSLEATAKNRAQQGVKTGVGSNLARVQKREKQLGADVLEAIKRQTGEEGFKGLALFMEGKKMPGWAGVNSDKAKADQELIQQAMLDQDIQYKVTKDTLKFTGMGGREGKRQGNLIVGGLDTGAGEGFAPGFVAQGIKEGSSDPKFKSVEANLTKQDMETLAARLRGTKNEQIQDSKNTRKINTEITEDGVLKAMNKHREENRLQELKDAANALGISGAREMEQDQLARAIVDKTKSMTSEDIDKQYGRLRYEAITGNQVAATLLKPKPINDILITNDGQVWKLNERDRMTSMGGGSYAMSKPGGAIDEYVGKRMGNVGGGITINVNGAQNPEEVGRVVMRKIKEYQASSMGGVK